MGKANMKLIGQIQITLDEKWTHVRKATIDKGVLVVEVEGDSDG